MKDLDVLLLKLEFVSVRMPRRLRIVGAAVTEEGVYSYSCPWNISYQREESGVVEGHGAGSRIILVDPPREPVWLGAAAEMFGGNLVVGAA